MAKTSQSKFSTKTPIKLQQTVLDAFVSEYQGMIADPDLGASYAVNYALALHLHKLGYDLPGVKTRSELIKAGLNRRWYPDKPRKPLTEEQRLRKQERDRARRAKMKAERETANTKTEKGELS